MSEIPKAYEPQSVEEKWYQFWLDQKCFVAEPSRVSEKRPAYSIVIPPPNVTGMLHMGHVLNNTIQDILSRKARMDGKEVLWLPGTDHAGIATQVQVEKALKKEERKTKYDLGREEFLKRVWTWKEKHGGIIINQLKKLGCSCDWTRERFTMDPEYSRCVQKVFVELYKKGLIYRGKRMVNWCPVSQTALSDEEVEMKPQKGFMYHFKVEVAGLVDASGNEVGQPPTAGAVRQAPPLAEATASGGARMTSTGEGAGSTTATVKPTGIWLTIATTRPETIPGDTAVAVNPKDTRYAHLIGKHIIRPLPIQLPREQKLIPIIGDEHVDFEFGTGVLKVTPAHDKADFEIGARHKLPLIDIMNPNGTMNDLAGESLAGLDRFEARKVAVERLKELDAMIEEKPYENNVGYSQRADVPIEPRLSEQWFLKYPSVEQSKACVEQEDNSVGRASSRAESSIAEDGSRGRSPHQKMQFHPQRWAKTYDHWLTNIQDWCISRQLWWGHRIPVWSLFIPAAGMNSLPSKELNESVDAFYKRVNFTDPQALSELSKTISLSGHDDSQTFFTFVWNQPRQCVEAFASTDSDAEAKVLTRSGFTQDPDVLDTWFSSWLWPFATMGWPEKTPTLQKFYPTTDLVTGPDIIFFWVARMIMAGYEYMGDLPFKNVYFTGIIRDKQGRKMSKTLGNSPDPLVLISQYGADALRFGTMRSAPLGQDVLFDEKDVELGRNFCNKLWNACRFRQMQGQSAADILSAENGNFRQDVGSTFEVEGEIRRELLTSDDKWILLKLDQAIREVTTALAEYKFSDATAALYRFFWSEYCDWYVEASKAVFFAGSSRGDSALTDSQENDQSGFTSAATAQKQNTLAVMDFILSNTLRLFHPFLPFITEELWHGMGFNKDLPAEQGGNTIMFAHWPKPLDEEFKSHYVLDETDEQFVNAKYELVTQGRNLRREGNIPSSKRVKFVFKPSGELKPLDAEVLKILLNAESLEVNPAFTPKKGTPQVLSPLGELYLPLEGLIDVDAEKARLGKELEKIEAEIGKVQAKLSNPAFTEKVPAAVLDEHKKRLEDWQAKKQKVQSALVALA